MSATDNAMEEILTPEPDNEQTVETEVECATEAESSTCDMDTGPRWDFLPDLAVVRIFAFLDDDSRLKASLTCKNWAILFRSPVLWRRGVFRFGGRNGQKSIGYAESFGRHLRYLKVCSEHPSLHGCKRFQKNFTDFLAHLSTQQANIRTFSLTQLHVERYWRLGYTRDKLLSSLSRFLRHQSQLRRLNMSEAMLPLAHGLRLLEAVGIGCGRVIHRLNLEDFFHSRLSLFQLGRYERIMQRFHNLNSLFLNYNCVSDTVLQKLAKNCAGKLRYFKIKVYKHDPHFHRIDRITWKELRRACPQLKVHMYFEGIGQYDIMRHIVLKEAAITTFYIWTGIYQGLEEWGLNQLLKHLADSFPNSLEEVTLNLENQRDVIDEGLLYMLEKCKHLEQLDLQAAIMVPTAADIYKMQLEYKIGLQKCHLLVDSLNLAEMDELNQLYEEYEPMIYERGLDFRLVANEDYPYL